MPRKGSVPKREVLQDPVYGEVVITKLINQVMLDGKRGTAQRFATAHLILLRKRPARTLWKCSIRLSITLCLFLK